MKDESNYEKVMKGFEELKTPITIIANDENLFSNNEQFLYSNADILSTYAYPIFSLNDLIAYRSVIQFYAKDYKNSLHSLYSLEKFIMSHSNDCFNTGSNIYSFIFSPMTLHECYYNMILCNIALNNLTEALKVANQLLLSLKSQLAFWIVLIRFIIQQALGQNPKRILIICNRNQRTRRI